MEGPAAGGQPAQIALSPLGAPSRGSSPRTRARGAAEAMGRRPCPARAWELPVPTRFSRPARGSVTASAEASGGARVPARGCLGRQPRRPGRRRRSPAPVRSSRTPTAAPPGLPAGSHRLLRLRGPVCPQTGSSGLRQGRRAKGVGGSGPAPDPLRHRQVDRPRWGESGSLPGISMRAHVPRGRWRTRASRPRAPGSIFSPH